MKLWGIGTTRTFRAHFALMERGFDYETIPIRTRTPDQDRPDFRAVSVSGKIPVLEHGDLQLNESAAIASYVMKLDQPLRSPSEQALIDQWMFFTAMELDATSLYILRRHEDLWQIYGKADEAVKSSKAYFDRQINALSERLLDGRPFVSATGFSEADILLISVLDWAYFLKLPLPGPAKRYAEGIRAREAYKKGFYFQL